MTSTHPIITLKIYGAVLVALLCLTAVTTGVAFLDLGSYFNTVVALTIACAKATLVGLYFMHLRYSQPLTLVLAGAGVFWLLILVLFTMTDVLTRDSISAVVRQALL
jgi:cytochrome c oxidase subunit 4